MTSTMGRDPAQRKDRGRDGEGLSVSSLEAPKRRKPSWMAVGALLVGLAGLLGAYVFSVMSDTVSVTVASHDIAPGEVLGPDDIRVVEMGRTADLRAVQAEQQDLILGLAARGPIPAGTVLNTGLFIATDEVVPAGKVVVGASLPTGAVPTRSLGAGDEVGLISVASGAGTASGQVQPAADLGSATVWAVENNASTGSPSDRVWVSLVIDEADRVAVAQAASNETLRLVLLGAS
jgi:hypothetical protein